MSVSVIVCNGCCCGNLEKGYDEVPVEFLEQAWVENKLGQEAQLTISGWPRTVQYEERRAVEIGR